MFTYNNIRTKKGLIFQLIMSNDQRWPSNTLFFYQSNQSNCAFYQSKGLVDWSLDEPLNTCMYKPCCLWIEKVVTDITNKEWRFSWRIQ